MNLPPPRTPSSNPGTSKKHFIDISSGDEAEEASVVFRSKLGRKRKGISPPPVIPKPKMDPLDKVNIFYFLTFKYFLDFN